MRIRVGLNYSWRFLLITFKPMKQETGEVNLGKCTVVELDPSKGWS